MRKCKRLQVVLSPSSETQGQLVGAGKSLNGRGKKSGEEKSRTKYRALYFVLDFSSPDLHAGTGASGQLRTSVTAK